MNKIYYTYDQMLKDCQHIIDQIKQDNYKPNYLVGITRGGLSPAVVISHQLGIKLYTLDVSLRDFTYDIESNCWMSEDIVNGKKILIIDDINDTGQTFAWIKRDWELSSGVGTESWNNLWNLNVKTASLYDNQSSGFRVNYSANVIDKSQEDCWVVFPWEQK